MDIVRPYRKKRSEFGRHCEFENCESETIIDRKPEEDIAELYILQNPCMVGVQCASEMNEHKVLSKKTSCLS